MRTENFEGGGQIAKRSDVDGSKFELFRR
jgi:hypothetical protein